VKRMGTAARLLALYEALQCRDTTFGQVLEMAAACGIDGRQVLANHFTQPLVIPGSLEA
jgi:hypothetical protein